MLEVSSEANDKIIEELSKDYCVYIKVDLPTHTKKIHETIEEMLIRLEEFESIVGMVQNLRAECAYEYLVRFHSIYPQLLELCKRIDALEHVVARANIDLTNLEAAVESAENELGGHSTVSDRLLGMFNSFSLFKAKTSETSLPTLPKNERQMMIDLPPIFKTSDAFKQS